MRKLFAALALFGALSIAGAPAVAQDKPAEAPAAAASAMTAPAATPAAAAPAAPKAAPAEKPAAAPAGPVFVAIATSKGDILLELHPVKAPVSVANFMSYVKKGFYDNTVFHRIVPGFVVQGGGFDGALVQKKTDAPIKNEWRNGLKNARGTISMARTAAPDSATSQFFLNLKDNPALDGANGPGYAVFGRIVVGLDVLDAMGAAPTARKEVTVEGGQKAIFSDVPAESITMVSAKEIDGAAAEAMMAAAKAKAAAPATAP